MNQALSGNIVDKKRLAHGLSAMEEGFLFGDLSRQIEKSFLCVLCGSAVKMLFWTGMIRFTKEIGYLSADRYEALWAKSQEGLQTLQGLISYVEKPGV